MRKLSVSNLYVGTYSLISLMVDCWVTVRILCMLYVYKLLAKWQYVVTDIPVIFLVSRLI